jgi:hypothetical protein
VVDFKLVTLNPMVRDAGRTIPIKALELQGARLLQLIFEQETKRFFLSICYDPLEFETLEVEPTRSSRRRRRSVDREEIVKVIQRKGVILGLSVTGREILRFKHLKQFTGPLAVRLLSYLAACDHGDLIMGLLDFYIDFDRESQKQNGRMLL